MEQLTLPDNKPSPPLCGITNVSELSVTTWNTSESLAVEGSLVLLELGAYGIIWMLYVLVMDKDLDTM